MSLSNSAEEALSSFRNAAGWEQRARLLMQWAERLPPLNEDEQSDANRVHGCESKVWLVASLDEGRWQFKAGSDARLIRGLLALLLVRVDGVSNEELQQLELPAWFDQLGLGRQLTPSRSNGLNAVLQRMAQIAAGG